VTGTDRLTERPIPYSAVPGTQLSLWPTLIGNWISLYAVLYLFNILFRIQSKEDHKHTNNRIKQDRQNDT